MASVPFLGAKAYENFETTMFNVWGNWENIQIGNTNAGAAIEIDAWGETIISILSFHLG